MSTVVAGPTATPPAYDPFSYEIHDDPYPTYAWMREHAPVFHNAERGFFALSRYADVDAALRDPGLYSNRNGISIEPELWGEHAARTSFYLAMDPPDHGPLRAITGHAFTPRRVAALEDRVRALARERLLPIREVARFDFAADYAAALPNDVTCELLGIPPEDWDVVRADTDLLNQRVDGSDARGSSSVTAALRLADYFVGLVTHLRAHPGDDLTSLSISADLDGRRLTDTELVAFLFLLVSAGNESTGKTIGNAWHAGHLMPDVRLAGLDGRAHEWAMETTRWDSASQMTARTLTRDHVLHGVAMPVGSKVLVLPPSANRDDSVFEAPDRFDLDRDTSRMMSFGRGPHNCLGGALARIVMPIALEEIGRIVEDYAVDEDRCVRIHSPHQRGFSSIPTEVSHRG